MILALESSCDETAAAVFDPARGLVGEWIHSQVALHGSYGGVVPDLATREHLRTVGPLFAEARAQVGFERVDLIAVTSGPGLAGCLAMGVAAAKALALALKRPLAGINHLRGHAFSPFIGVHAESPTGFDERMDALLPHLGLIVSGGNTLLFEIDRDRRLFAISSTRDDAAGEALDKGAKLLGLGYPGGPFIERHAAEGQADAYEFPRGLGPRGELDFSFSGLKTSLRYRLEKMTTAEVTSRLPHLCASYQQAVIDALIRKTRAAFGRGSAEGARFKSIGLSGGVANNRALRTAMERLVQGEGGAFLAAAPQHTGDNAAMIAFAAWADPAVSAVGLADLRIEPGAELV